MKLSTYETTCRFGLAEGNGFREITMHIASIMTKLKAKSLEDAVEKTRLNGLI